MEKEEIPILAGILIAPINGLELIGKYITDWITNNWKILTGVLCSIIVLRLIVHFVPKELFQAIWSFIVWNHTAFGAILGSFSVSVFLLIVAFYISVIYLLWKPESSNTFMIIGQGLWVLIVAYLCSYLGALQVPAFILIMVYGLIGIIYDMKDSENVSFMEKLRDIIKTQKTALDDSKDDSTSSAEHIEKELEEKDKEKESKPSMSTLVTRLQANENRNKMLLNVPSTPRPSTVKEEVLESDIYFKILFYCCVAAILWKHVWIMFLCFIPVSVYVSKVICHYIGLTMWLQQKYEDYSKVFLVREFLC